MLVDQAKVFVRAGTGGNGSSSFLREKYVPRGGPDGGDGGRGGDVVFEVVNNLNSLLPFQYVQHYEAEPGGAGKGRQMHGRNGKSKTVKVPPGTVIYLEDGVEPIADLTTPGEEFVVARGGRGGLGNTHFKSSRHRSPRMAELGEPGVQLWLRLELRLIADVGLVGLPNAGKSTLLAAATRARPKIADYPFTTLSPNLGVVSVGGPGGQAFVMADIPGLIEGAADGAGLGHDFLRHVRRTRVLVHVLDAAGGLEGRDPLVDFRTINAEIAAFDPGMTKKPMIVVLNKEDLVEARDNTPRLLEVLQGEGYTVKPISAATGEGVTDVFETVAGILRELDISEAEEKKALAAKPKRRIYTIGNVDERAWEAQRVGEGSFLVTGVGIERFTHMTNFDLWEASERYQRVLDKSGISAELNRLGIQYGDIVTIALKDLTWGDQEDEDGAFMIEDSGNEEEEDVDPEWLALEMDEFGDITETRSSPTPVATE